MTTIHAAPPDLSGSGVFNSTEKVAARSWAKMLKGPSYGAEVAIFEIYEPVAPGQKNILGYLVDWVQRGKRKAG